MLTKSKTIAYARALEAAAKYKKDLPPAKQIEAPIFETVEEEPTTNISSVVPRDMVHGLNEIPAEEGAADIADKLFNKGLEVGYYVGKEEALTGEPKTMSFANYLESMFYLSLPMRIRVNYSGPSFEQGWEEGYALGYDAVIGEQEKKNKKLETEITEDLKEALTQIRRKP